MNKLLIIALVSFSELQSQVGINTKNPQGVLDIVSTNSTMIIPRLPDPSVIPNPVEGMLAYDVTNKTIRYYDGSTWGTLMYSRDLTKSNEGVLKINGSGAGAGAKPTWNNVSANSVKQVTLSSPLVYATPPTTNWPDNSAAIDSKIYSGGKFLENAVKGQVHQWRVIINYTKSSNIYSQDITFALRNPSSGFKTEISGVIPSSKTSGTLMYNFTTIADNASLPSPYGNGAGYILEWVASDAITSLSIDSITRISFQKN